MAMYIYTRRDTVQKRKGIMKFSRMINSSFRLQARKYVFSIVFITFVTAIFFALRDVLDTTLIALLYLIPLGMITAYWGLGAGITSALVTFLAFNYLFIQPYYMLAVHQPSDVVILIVFLIVAVVISQFVARARAGEAMATAREREATKLYELSIALAGLHREHRIAEILAKHIHSTLHSEAVALNILSAHPFVFRFPESDPPVRTPELIVPIQAARGTLGEIRFGGLRQSSRLERAAVTDICQSRSTGFGTCLGWLQAEARPPGLQRKR